MSIFIGVIIGLFLFPLIMGVILFFKEGVFAERIWEIKKAIGRFLRREK